MTNVTIESLEVSGFEGMIREGPEVFDGLPGPLPCFVHHKDAGGECKRPAIGEVWSLPFCELHGREAELAAREEMATSLEGIFNGLVAVEQLRHDRNEIAVEILKAPAGSAYTQTLSADLGAHEAAMFAAYPPDELEGNTDADTLAYDYERTGEDGPYDWWCETQLMVCRFMRQAHDRGLAPLLRDLEYMRERATVQRLLADHYMDRKYGPARM